MSRWRVAIWRPAELVAQCQEGPEESGHGTCHRGWRHTGKLSESSQRQEILVVKNGDVSMICWLTDHNSRTQIYMPGVILW